MISGKSMANAANGTDLLETFQKLFIDEGVESHRASVRDKALKSFKHKLEGFFEGLVNNGYEENKIFANI